MDSALIIFVKNPEKGKVKTRLAKTLGDQKALNIYLKLLAKTRSAATQINCNRFVYYSSFIDQNDAWPNNVFRKRLQDQSDNLGSRMASAFQEITKNHLKTIIIGSDCPLINSDDITNAFAVLDHSDLVIGPAIDGGYYLLGLKKFVSTIFENINWSSPNVFKETIYLAIKSGLFYTVLPTLPDIDFEQDWEKWGWED